MKDGGYKRSCENIQGWHPQKNAKDSAMEVNGLDNFQKIGYAPSNAQKGLSKLKFLSGEITEDVREFSTLE